MHGACHRHHRRHRRQLPFSEFCLTTALLLELRVSLLPLAALPALLLLPNFGSALHCLLPFLWLWLWF